MDTVEINVWAVLAAALINMVVGTVWYMPNVLGKQWAKFSGKKLEDMGGRNPSMAYTVTALGAVVQSYILALLVDYAAAGTALEGAAVGLLGWLGFTAAATVSDTVFAGRSWKLWQITNGYYLVVLLINGALLAVWT